MIIYNDQVILIEDTNEQLYDDYGRPLTKKRTLKAHVRYKTQTIYNSNGEKTTSTAQIYVPFIDDINPATYAPRVEIKTPNQVIELGQSIRVEYGQDIAGNPHFLKIYL